MSKHLFSLNDILPDRTLDGEFAAYSVFTHVPDHSTALILLRTLASIVASLMTRHGLEIDLLEESYASNRELGRNLFTAEYDPDNKTHNPYRSHTVQIRLRHETVPDMYLSLGELPCTLCHELAHCWYLEHEQVFYMKWIELMNEVTQDLEDSVIIDWGCGPDEQMLRCFRVDPGLRLDNGDRKAMAAAKDWVNFYWEFLCEQGQPADRRKRELKLPERGGCEQSKPKWKQTVAFLYTDEVCMGFGQQLGEQFFCNWGIAVDNNIGTTRSWEDAIGTADKWSCRSK